MEDLQTKIEKIITFLKNQLLDPQFAYSVSSLPFPLEVMRKVLQFYAASLNRRGTSQEDLLKMKAVKSLYINLGDYIDEEDAELASQFNERYVDISKESDPHKVADKEKDIRSTQGYERYLHILETIKSNKAKLREEIEPLISQETAG